MLRPRTLFKLAVMQVKLFLREPIGLFFILLMPPMLLVLMGFILGNEPAVELGNRGHLDMNLPGYAAMIIGIFGITGAPIETATRRDNGVLRRFRATPLRPATYIAGDVVASFGTIFLGVSVLFALGMLVYGVQLHGSPLALIAAVSLSSAAFLALAYLLAGLYRNVRVAMVVGNVLIYPMLILSGAMIPAEIMPDAVQSVSRFVPLTYVVTLIRGVWGGHSLGDHIPEIAVLAGIVVLGAVLASRTFRWE